MRIEDASPSADQTIRLSDYQRPDWLIEETRLFFDLHPTATRVRAALTFVRNPERAGDGPADLTLDGHSMTLLAAAVDGADVTSQITTTATGLTTPAAALPQDRFVWTCETEIDPTANTSLEGLYVSNGMYCTQCEAEGFRKITYYPDRPDVMTRFRVRIEADKTTPILLSNGNPDATGDLDGARHFAEWTDPWPKPAYLFALVAGDLVSHDDDFTTMSGRKVDLKIWVRPGDEDRCAYAMDALKRSMTWDEEVYGREYDLDLFQIVAVEDFNMGAMENKGLNIFNSKYVLASPQTATDRDYEFIEGIIAHEYFHNWTGNRITCRDWFQLCLKEGLTVFRDQQFSQDMRSEAVCRINDVKSLRARQFREDAGPLAHSVRPEEYIEINNFYTATVYEKGAEVIGMLRRLVGAEAYDAALKLYFDRHDGQACTIEEWLKVFEDANGRDLSQFALWYSQAGTPTVTVEESFNSGVYLVTLTQSTPDTPGQTGKKPMTIPLSYGLIGPDGKEMIPGDMFVLTKPVETFRFELYSRPVLSLNRGFSAPVLIDKPSPAPERAFLMANDIDPINKWEAGRSFGVDVAHQLIADPDADLSPVWVPSLNAVLEDAALDPAFKAMILTTPGHDEMAAEIHRMGHVVDPEAIHAALTLMATDLANALKDGLEEAYHAMTSSTAYSPDATGAGRRSLRNQAMGLLTRIDDGALAAAQFADADNMTDSLAALGAMVANGTSGADAALATFHDRWKDDPLVMDKWYVVQATSAADGAFERVQALAETLNWRNPNKFRSLIGAFAAANPVQFHKASGAGYRFFADWLIRMDEANPQTAARTAGAFETWRRYSDDRQDLMKAEMTRVLDRADASKDISEILGRVLDA